jgi:hypothetical protein
MNYLRAVFRCSKAQLACDLRAFAHFLLRTDSISAVRLRITGNAAECQATSSTSIICRTELIPRNRGETLGMDGGLNGFGRTLFQFLHIHAIALENVRVLAFGASLGWDN